MEPYLAAVDAGGATALYSAIKQGIRTFSTVHPEDPKAIIALTDGEDSGIPGKTTHQEGNNKATSERVQAVQCENECCV